MTTIRYSRYVLIDEGRGSVAWYENPKEAEKAKNRFGGVLFDLDSDNPITIEHALQSARHRMGVE